MAKYQEIPSWVNEAHARLNNPNLKIALAAEAKAEYENSITGVATSLATGILAVASFVMFLAAFGD